MPFTLNTITTNHSTTNLKFSAFFLLIPALFSAQSYAPSAGQPGTTAMHKDSVAFVAWATGCESVRGLQNIAVPAGPYASVGDNSMVLGKAQSNAVLSLGDGGSAVCTFALPIMNGPGPDFAVFENSFDDNFLELAYVEVSSDGINFTRFRAHSLTDTLTQTDSFGSTNATKINNLAGKYRGGYGTPFDLQELAGAQGLNVNAVTHVRIVDVIGSVNASYASRDGYGNKVNDPWPTDFPSGGFDLDAVGVIHRLMSTGSEEWRVQRQTRFFPNPVGSGHLLHIDTDGGLQKICILDLSGRVLLESSETELRMPFLPSGIYLIQITTGDSLITEKLILR